MNECRSPVCGQSEAWANRQLPVSMRPKGQGCGGCDADLCIELQLEGFLGCVEPRGHKRARRISDARRLEVIWGIRKMEEG